MASLAFAQEAARSSPRLNRRSFHQYTGSTELGRLAAIEGK